MKILLDESVPIKLRQLFPDDFEVYTVRYMGWVGIANGELLQLVATHGFEALVTVDKGFEFQQNLEVLTIPIVIMHAPSNSFEVLHSLVPKVVSVLSGNLRNKIYRVMAEIQ